MSAAKGVVHPRLVRPFQFHVSWGPHMWDSVDLSKANDIKATPVIAV